jgi:hypothetical protein
MDGVKQQDSTQNNLTFVIQMSINAFPRIVFVFFAFKSCQWSLMSLITGNKVKKHASQGIVKKNKDKANKTMAWSSACFFTLLPVIKLIKDH